MSVFHIQHDMLFICFVFIHHKRECLTFDGVAFNADGVEAHFVGSFKIGSGFPIRVFPDFVNASPTRNSLTHKPQRERDILKTSRIGYGGAILFISQRVTQTKIITSDYQIVTFAL